jgi:hypothetical protein
MVHAMVAEAFIGPCPAGLEVNHRNGVKIDNAVANLEYMTHSKNLFHAVRELGKRGRRGEEAFWMVKLTAVDVPVIRAAKISGTHVSILAKQFGVTINAIYAVCSRRSWRHIA